MLPVKRQRTYSAEEDCQRQDKLQEAYNLTTVLQQQLNEKEQESLVLKNEIDTLRRVETIPYAQVLITNREQYIFQQQIKIEELIIENNTLKEEKESSDRKVVRLESEVEEYARDSALSAVPRKQQQKKKKIEELTFENRELKKIVPEQHEKKIMELIKENNALKENKESTDYEVIRLKRDAECYSRYFAQYDDECEGLREQIRNLKAVNGGHIDKEDSDIVRSTEEIKSSVDEVEEQNACDNEEVVLDVDSRSFDGKDDEDDEFFEFDDNESLSSEEYDEIDDSEDDDEDKAPLFQDEDDWDEYESDW
ncbi:hypothetical protein K501DRAFT_330046 [Backusella circina FSU 941]|nr:hypothetical protein K501DRAFT_330046 [Backusella circina FSU 941]